MAATILVAGATGDLGGRIIKALHGRGATVKALARKGADKAKTDKLQQPGVEVIEADMLDVAALTKACTGVSCVVSALQGLHDVIVDVQSALLEAAVAAGVPRFIPSDYASDITKVQPGTNRNFDLRREFHERLNKAPIAATSILNGGFAELLTYNIPLLNFKDKTIGYWENPDWRVDFTTMDNTAAYTADAALDDAAPRILRIAGFQVSPNELAGITGEMFGEPFRLIRMGSLDDLAAFNKKERAAHPEGEKEIYPAWQQSQYMHSMFSTQLTPLDNGRYHDIQWTGIKELLTNMQNQRRQ